VSELNAVKELNLPVALTTVFVIIALFVMVLMDARVAAIKLIDSELSASVLTDAFAAIIV
jgi:hypothetical protein